jgi:glycosyltransferase involved in cell wall biosynthesis
MKMEQQYPKISIITPSYNQGEYIEETITSILDQGYPNLELIVMDGGSTDETVEILKKYDDQITFWQSELDKGQTDAINNGFKKCTGDIVTWLCSDDYYEGKCLFKVAEAFLNNLDINLVCGDRRTFGLGIKDTHYIGWESKETLEETMFYGHYDQPPSFYRKEVWDSIFPLTTELRVYMDCEMWLMYLLKYGMNKAMHIENLFAHGRFHATSKSVNEAVLCRRVLNSLYWTIGKSLGIDSLLLSKMGALDRQEYHRKWDVEAKVDLKNYEKYLIQKFGPQFKDPSYIYRDVAGYFMSLGNPKAAMSNAMHAIKINPFKLINYRAYFYCLRNYFK